MVVIGGAQEAAPPSVAPPDQRQEAAARTESGTERAVDRGATGAGTAPTDPGGPPSGDGDGAVDLAHAVVVADDVSPGPRQVRRSELLARGTLVVRRVADVELAAVGRSTDTCPYIEAWIDRFATYPADRLEQAVVRFAQPTDTSVDGYLHGIEARVRRAVRTWIASGRVDLPDGVTSAHPGGETAALRRSRIGPARPSDPTTAVVSSLGPGRPLPGSARTTMEGTFGEDLSSVRIHTDGAAADASRAQRARAMAVGDHVVFGAGRFDPSSIRGRALLAHELAHVVQQRGGTSTVDEAGDEREADQAAAAGLAGGRVRIRGRGGLRLRRCPQDDGTDYEASDHDESHDRLAHRTPEEMIADHTNELGDLNEESLAKTLAQMLWYTPADHADYVRRVFEALESHNTDDVGALMLAELQDRDLAEIAAHPHGRRLLEYLVPELESGWTFPGSDLHAATRAARAAVARRSSAAAVTAELEAMDQALDAVPTPAIRPVTGTATVAERRSIVTSDLSEFDLGWPSSRPVAAAVATARTGLAATSNPTGPQAARLPFAQASLPIIRLLLTNLDAQIARVRRSPSGTSEASLELFAAVRTEILGALAHTFAADGARRLVRAQTAFDRLGFSLTRLELAVLENRPTQFDDVKPKLERMRAFARWTTAELDAVRNLRPTDAAGRAALDARMATLVQSSRLLAHWEVLIQTAEALESGFSFTEFFHWNSVDIDSIHGRLSRLAARAEGGQRQSFASGVQAFADDGDIKEFYDDVPSILRSSGIAVGIIITVVAAAATMGAGSVLGIGAGTAAGASASTAVGTFVAATAVDALVFTTVHSLLANATGMAGSSTFFEELAWNFGLFGVLRLGGGALGRSMLAKGYSRTAVTAAQLAGSATLLEVYGVFRFWLAEDRLPDADELRLMTGEMLVVLALLVALHVAVEPHTPLAKFDKEFGNGFRSIEADRAALQADVNQALHEGRMAQSEAAFRQRGEALEQRTKTWAEEAAQSSRVPAVRNQLRGMRDVQQQAAAYLAESLGLPAAAEARSAGPASDFTIAHGTVPEVRQSLAAQGAEVNVLRIEGEPSVVEARFRHGEVLHFAERSPTATEQTRTRRAARRDPASEEAAELAPDLTPAPTADPVSAGRHPNLLDAQGRFTNAEVEVDYQAYKGRGGTAERVEWMSRTGGGPLARLRAWLGPEFRPPRSRRHADRPRLAAVPNPVPIRSFHDPVAEALRPRQQQILELAERDALQAGVEYQELVAQDLGASDVQEWSQRPHRRNDIGGGVGRPAFTRGKEVTIEGRSSGFGTGKLDQLWLDLEQTGGITLIVPRLSQAARTQLGRMVRQFMDAHPDAGTPTISIRETLPPASP